MNISYNWLRRYLDTDLSAEQLAVILTDIGLEVEGLEKIEGVRGGLEGVRRAYMYVNGQWRDHESYVLMAEDAPNGFTARLMTGNSPS